MSRTFVALGAVAIAIAVAITAGARHAEGAVLCQKKNGTIVVRDTSCKQKEKPFDVEPFVPGLQALPQVMGQVADLEATVTTLSAKNVLEAGTPGTVAAYATVNATGTLAEGFTQSGAVSAGRSGTGSYVVSFGFTLRATQPIIVTGQIEYYNQPACWLGEVLSTQAFGPVYIYCRTNGVLTDTAFTVVVLN